MAEEIVQAAVLLGALLFLSKIGEEAAERAGLPGFSGSIIVGVLLSNAVLGLASPSKLGHGLLLFVIGINFTLFLAGIEELSNPSLLRPHLSEVVFTFTLLLLPTLSVAAFSTIAWGLGFQDSLALGVTMALVSAGPLMKILLARGALGDREARLLRIGLLAEVAGLVLFNALVQGFSLRKLIETIVFVIAVYMFGRHYLGELMVLIERHIHVKEAPFAIVIAMVTMTGYIAEMIGFNAAVTALLLGVFLSGYMEARPFYLERIRALTYGFLEPLFFIGIGVYASKPKPLDLLYSALVLALASAPKIVMATRIGYTPRESLTLLAKGGVDAALLLALLQSGAIGERIYTSMLVTLIASTLISSSAHRMKTRKPDILRYRLAEARLDMDIVDSEESAEYAARLVAEKGAVVVVDRFMRPIGYVTAEDFVEVDPAMLRRIPIKFFMRTEIPIVHENTTVAEIIGDPTLIREPIIAVVDDKGETKGTITPRKLLEAMIHREKTE
ncbi:MAG: hypothetical protein DSY37_02095 [Hyperthermus sp.]|nr:MAG: hypothetical protein DSY37_02095 [Hyperthermus sp.]